MKSPIKYYGGKSYMTKIILSHFPKDYDIYVEGFGGGASVLFKKPQEGIEIYKSTDGTNYKLEQTLNKTQLAQQNNEIIIEVAPGEHNYYKVRAYKTVNGKKVYSEYSKVVDISISSNCLCNNTTSHNTSSPVILFKSSSSFSHETDTRNKTITDKIYTENLLINHQLNSTSPPALPHWPTSYVK